MSDATSEVVRDAVAQLRDKTATSHSDVNSAEPVRSSSSASAEPAMLPLAFNVSGTLHNHSCKTLLAFLQMSMSLMLSN